MKMNQSKRARNGMYSSKFSFKNIQSSSVQQKQNISSLKDILLFSKIFSLKGDKE